MFEYSGVVTLLLTNPILVAKTRLCLQYESTSSNKLNSKYYTGMVDCLSKTYKSEGFKGFYKVNHSEVALLKGLERKAWLIRIACLDTIYCLSIFISTCSKSASQLGRHGANINPTAFHPPPTTTPLQF